MLVRLLYLTSLTCALAITGVLANTARPEKDFKENIFDVVKSSAPLFHFHIEDNCLPTAAVLDNDVNKPNPGGSGRCITKKPTSGSGMTWEIVPRFPTYYYVGKCDFGGGDVQYRILYDLYIPQDTYHKHDWEWAIIVIWKKQSNGEFLRDSVFLEQHGNHKYVPWGNLPHTLNHWPAEKDTLNIKNGNHPRLFIQRVGHPVHETGSIRVWHQPKCNSRVQLDCDGYYRNDFGHGAWTASFLKNGVKNLPDQTWGSADSPPHAFQPGKHRDICRIH